MYLYNITVIVETDSAFDFLQWVNANFVDKIMQTECFVSNRFLKIVDSPNDGVSYCLQFIAETLENYSDFKENHEQTLLAQLYTQFDQKLVTFSTLMEFLP
ncbi:DUF4286 family protein [Pedobacter montanisoli]|uniref:DUF4286 family protein n=1 Tax=Pedobacter montanisoli TaxID=2923277 RepID=A0ABS9ZRL4_9SPHI|nr:DUF4286 family protein [Pedobacter montanisoli]MCJ0741229.1 DUF4286 family protein [Pedobacter montanisoli]